MSRSLKKWLVLYEASHRHKINQALHWVCIPGMMLTVTMLSWWLPVVPGVQGTWNHIFWPLVACTLLWYWRLDNVITLGIGMVWGLFWVVTLMLERELNGAFISWALGLFSLFWLGALCGVLLIEKHKLVLPRDIRLLLIGPAWMIEHLFRLLGWRRPDTL